MVDFSVNGRTIYFHKFIRREQYISRPIKKFREQKVTVHCHFTNSAESFVFIKFRKKKKRKKEETHFFVLAHVKRKNLILCKKI